MVSASEVFILSTLQAAVLEGNATNPRFLLPPPTPSATPDNNQCPNEYSQIFTDTSMSRDLSPPTNFTQSSQPVHQSTQTLQSCALLRHNQKSRKSLIPRRVTSALPPTKNTANVVVLLAPTPNVSVPPNSHHQHASISAPHHYVAKSFTSRAPATKSASHQRSSARVTAKKDPCRGSANYPSVSDARCIRRMLTDSAPIKSPVTCFASTEFRNEKNHPENNIHQSDMVVESIQTDQAEVSLLVDSSSHSNQVHLARDSKSSNQGYSDLSRRHSVSTSSLYSVRSSTSTTTLPKWRPAGSTSSSSHSNSNTMCKNDGSSCIPKPSDLRVTRRVGVDGVVLAWSPLDHDCVAGFQVVVSGKVVQQVKSPHRTKALITGLSMTTPCTIGLISVGIDGRCSKPAVVTCDRSSVYPNRNPRRAALPSRRTAVPTCI